MNELGFQNNWIMRNLSIEDPDLFERFTRLEKLLREDVLQFVSLPDFTDHGIKHAINVRDNLARLTPENIAQPFTWFELFALLAASLLHDVGMIITKTPEEDPQEIRIDHFNRSKEFVLKNYSKLGLSLHEGFIIGEICRAHGMPSLDYLEGKPFSLSKYGAVRITLLSALLRLADALDLTADRAPIEVSQHRMMPKTSRYHWKLHESISDVQIKTAPSWDIRICAIPTEKSIELALYELRNIIQNEIDTISPVLRAAGIFFKKVDLEINAMYIEKMTPKLKNPFLQLASYNGGKAFLFAGRDREINQVIQRILSRKLVVVIGESGVGKSSLVEAGVIPKLKSFGYGIVRFSFQEDPVHNLIEALNNFSKTRRITKKPDSHDANPATLVSLVSGILGKQRSLSRLLIIGDHLEQMFTVMMEQDARNAFVQQIASVLGELCPDRVTFLFCIRDDYLRELYDLSNDIPELYDRGNTFKLQRLNRDGAIEALKRASEHGKVPIADALIQRIVDDLCAEGEGMVYPPFLQIVGFRLYMSVNKTRGPINARDINMTLYDKLGGAETIVKRFFDSLLDHLTEQDKSVVIQILGTMVTEQYTKRRVTDEYLRRVLPDCVNIDKLLKNLIQNRIIRRNLGDYELVSDCLALRVIELMKSQRFLSAPVRKALEYINSNYHEFGLRSRDIANSAEVTQMHLASLFRQQLGRTINYQLNATRIAKAKEMLTKNRDSLAEVANRTGFRSLSSFSRKFKEIDGSSPIKYRNMLMTRHVWLKEES